MGGIEKIGQKYAEQPNRNRCCHYDGLGRDGCVLGFSDGPTEDRCEKFFDVVATAEKGRHAHVSCGY